MKKFTSFRPFPGAAVAEAIEAACDLGALVRGKSVLVKPNVFAPIPPPGTATRRPTRSAFSITGASMRPISKATIC